MPFKEPLQRTYAKRLQSRHSTHSSSGTVQKLSFHRKHSLSPEKWETGSSRKLVIQDRMETLPCAIPFDNAPHQSGRNYSFPSMTSCRKEKQKNLPVRYCNASRKKAACLSGINVRCLWVHAFTRLICKGIASPPIHEERRREKKKKLGLKRNGAGQKLFTALSHAVANVSSSARLGALKRFSSFKRPSN